MIIKDRGPTMRHVSGTHRVALDWLLDRINLDPKVQIKCVESRNQLADILTKGSFTHDEWHNLLHFFTWWTTRHFPAGTFPTAILLFRQESNLRCREDLRKALRLDRQWWKQKHVVSFHMKACLWDKIIRVILQVQEVQETLNCGLGKKEVQNLDGILFSMPRKTERMVQEIL